MEKSFYLLNSQEIQVSWEEVMMVVETEPSAYIIYTKRLEPLTICKPYTCFVFILIAAATSDITVSLAWCPYDSNVLITGQGPKYIRAFDIRGEQSVKLVGLWMPCFVLVQMLYNMKSICWWEINLWWTLLISVWTPRFYISFKRYILFCLADTFRPQNAAVTKAVYGVCFDPLVEHRIASFSGVRIRELSQHILK